MALVQKPFMGNQRIVVNCLHTALGTSWATLNDAAAGYPTLSGGEQVEAVSDSANDTAAGTGARTWGITYLDTDGLIQTETGSFNGTSAVASTVTAAIRILDFWCDTYGSGGTNAGNITLRKVSAGGNRTYIAAGRRRAAMATFTVPDCHIFSLEGAQFSNSNPVSGTPLAVSYMIEADINPITGALNEGVFTTLMHGTSGLHKPTQMVFPHGHHIDIPAYATVRATGISGVASTEVAGMFFGTLTADKVVMNV